MTGHFKDVLLAALLSSGLFLFIVTVGLDFIFMFISILPLFSVGLGKSPRLALEAGAAATLIISVMTTSISLPIMFFVIFTLPCYRICSMSLRYADINIPKDATPMNISSLRLWFPTGIITLHLALYACIFLALTTAFFAMGETSLPSYLSQMLSTEIDDISKNYELQMPVSSEYLTFMLCGFLAWIWGILLLAHAWFANRALVKKKISIRPSLAILPFQIPHWMFSLIGICALAALIGGESMRFLGKSCLIILLIPYFFQGAAIINLSALHWKNRSLILFLIYFFAALLLWPIFIIAGIGLWNHAKILNKHLSSDGNSFKS